MKYGYFPGCSAESTARDMHISTIAVAKALGIELVEPEGWTCCGATAGHQTDHILAASLSAATLIKAKDMGMDMVANCAACYNRMKVANHEIASDSQVRTAVAQAVGQDYDGSVKIKHFVEVLLQDVGIDTIKASLKKSLSPLKVACYYGCLLVRPSEATQFDDAENPTSLDTIVDALGCKALDWPHKTECCGGGLAMSRTDIVVSLTESVLSMAKAAGADCIAVSCPMCQINLDMRQKDIAAKMGTNYEMPIIYITQLLGLCLGISAKELAFDKLIVPAEKVLKVASDTA